MKVGFFALTISICWHLIFLFLVQPTFYGLNVSSHPPPKIRFLGQIVESKKVEFSGVNPRKEDFLFWNYLFEAGKDYFDSFPSQVLELVPLKKLEFQPRIRKVTLKEVKTDDYLVLFSRSKISKSTFVLELDQFLNPKLVLPETIRAELESDFKLWLKAKSCWIYSPQGGKVEVGSNGWSR